MLALLLVLFGDLPAYLVHVEGLDLGHEILERGRRQGPGLVEHEDAFPERHDRGDGPDVRRRRDALFGFGVDLGVHDVRVLLRGRLERGGEGAARPAPRRPEVDEDHVVTGDDVVEVLLGESLGGHRDPFGRVLIASTSRRDRFFPRVPAPAGDTHLADTAAGPDLGADHRPRPDPARNVRR
ncbi:hypothetical protein RHRU231_90033 [Rhodococcus ruber]|uniref:Uncharacterized protein n=1 Tax=Rhodococcus ruber TaxID=1830 RepID=A0A098BTE1_9NOCA|nr:hypothetical protein RHRU231_90033 [Rhodococcus ruber]